MHQAHYADGMIQYQSIETVGFLPYLNLLTQKLQIYSWVSD